MRLLNVGQTSPKVILLVVVAIAFLALIGVASLSAALFYHAYADPAILTALIALTSGLVGSLTTILSSPRSMTPPAGSDTVTQISTTTTTSTPPAKPAAPAKVEVVNSTSNPVPTTDQP